MAAPPDRPAPPGRDADRDGRDRDWDVGGRIAGRLRDAGREAGQLLAPLAPRVPRLVERRTRRVGQAPGVLVLPEAPVRPARVSAFHYTPDAVEEHADLDAAAARALADRPGVTWVDVVGVADVAAVAAVGAAFGLHPLVVEDLVQTTQRPKIETYDGALFVVARMVRATDADAAAAYAVADTATPGHLLEQVGLVLGDGWVLSFQEDDGDVFGAVRDRLRRGVGRIRTVGADYLFYALLDLVVEHVFVTLERMGDATEILEARALDDPRSDVQAAISSLRREVVVLRRAVWPLREVLARLQDDDVPFVEDRTRLYLRDAADHLAQSLEILESLREVLASTNDLYLSALGARQNEVMKVLTVVGTIFLPLGFLTGLYGMNFDVIPELHWRYGYFALLALMALVTAGALVYFRKNDWI